MEDVTQKEIGFGDALLDSAYDVLCAADEGSDPTPSIAILLEYCKTKPNDSNAYIFLSQVYGHRNNSRPDYDKAFEMAVKAVTLGNPYGYYLLTDLLSNDSHRVKVPHEEAVYYARLGSDQGDRASMSWLSTKLLSDKSLERYEGESLELLIRAAKEGDQTSYDALPLFVASLTEKQFDSLLNVFRENTRANNLLLYKSADECIFGENSDVERGIALVDHLYKRDSSLVLNEKGTIELLGLRGTIDLMKAREFYERSIQNGDPNGMTLMAETWTGSYGSEVDYDKAATYLRMAFKHGDILAGLKLSNYIINGKTDALHEFELRDLFIAAAHAGNREAKFKVALYHEKGIMGFSKDADLALHMLEGLKEELASAKTALGIRYLEGKGVVQNISYGMRLLYESAESDDPDALDYIGSILMNGDFNQVKNEGLAVEYFSRAYENGNQSSAIPIAWYYAERVDQPSQYPLALKWLYIAAELGELNAFETIDNLLQQAAYQGIDPQSGELIDRKRLFDRSSGHDEKSGIDRINVFDPSKGIQSFQERATSGVENLSDKLEDVVKDKVISGAKDLSSTVVGKAKEIGVDIRDQAQKDLLPKLKSVFTNIKSKINDR